MHTKAYLISILVYRLFADLMVLQLLSCPVLVKYCQEIPLNLLHNTVKPRCTDTPLIQTPLYHGHFVLSLGKENPYSFSKFNQYYMDTLLTDTDTFYGPVSVCIELS